MHGASPGLLDNYAEARRRIFLERTNPASTANLLRLYSQETVHVEERKQTFSSLNDPKDFINIVRIGLPDFGLTTTSDKIFDTSSEVTWFITVTKIPEWTEERFHHEYKTIHANMARGANEPVQVLRH